MMNAILCCLYQTDPQRALVRYGSWADCAEASDSGIAALTAWIECLEGLQC